MWPALMTPALQSVIIKCIKASGSLAMQTAGACCLRMPAWQLAELLALAKHCIKHKPEQVQVLLQQAA